MKNFIILFVLFLVPVLMQALHTVELGIGWENMGISPETTWKPYPYSAGSRKAFVAHMGWRNLGASKIYYSSFS